MSRFLRETKFRHTNVALSPRQEWYEQLRTATTVVSDGDLMSANADAFAYICNEGADVAVLPYSSVGKNHVPIQATAYQQPVIRAHSQQVTDLQFNPFHAQQICSVSNDATLKLFSLPENCSMVQDITNADLVVSGDTPLKGLQFHRSAEGVVAMHTARDVLVVDLVAGAVRLPLAGMHPADMYDMTWSWVGDLIATTSKDKALRVLDPRAAAVAAEAADAHGKAKTMRIEWLGDGNHLLTTGFSMMQEREMAVWDARNLGDGPVKRLRIDGSTGFVAPFYDADRDLLYLVGRGDTNVRMYEFERGAGEIHDIGNNSAGEVMRGATFVPAPSLNLMGCEVARMLKLVDGAVQPVSFTVPRREKQKYQEDLFPPTVCGAEAAISGEDWFSGQTLPPQRREIPPPEVQRRGRHRSSAEEVKVGDAADAEGAGEGEGESVGDGSATPASSRRSNTHSSFGTSLRFRHAHIKEPSKERTFFNLRPNISAPDTPLIASSELYWAVPWQGAGGAVYVSTHEQFGKVEPECRVVNGHRAPVLSVAFSPFDPSIMLTGSDDCHALMWRIPEGGVEESGASLGADDSLADLAGHDNAVRTIDFHPCAENVVLTSSLDLTMRLWDLERTEPLFVIEDHPDTISNCSFDYTGSMIATVCKDRLIRLFDPRADTPLVQSSAECGLRSARVEWCSQANTTSSALLVVGSRGGARHLELWDPRDLSRGAVTSTPVDHASGQLLPIWDEDTGVVFLTGKGDTTVRLFELQLEEEGALALRSSEVGTRASGPVVGLCALPKRSCNVRDIEVARILKLGTDSVVPIGFKVPRSQHLRDYFHDDLFPETRAAQPACTAAEWQGGALPTPIMQSLQPEGMTKVSEKPEETVERTDNRKSAKYFQEQINKERAEDEQRKEVFSRLQNLAITRSKFHPNESMGRSKVDAAPVVDDDSDGGWSDDDA